MNDRPIGLFDSGVGGLTVLKQMMVQLPDEKMIYLGDTARLPYGIKSRETVVRYSLHNAEFLLDKGIKCLVVACNTASSLALQVLEARFPVPIIGVILPGAAKAALCSRKRRVGVIGTMATVRSRAYEEAIRDCRKDIQVFSEPCPLFVSLAEEGWIEDDITYAIARRYLAPLIRQQIDVLVLGCTHYPLLKPVLSRVMGPSVLLVDSAEEVPVQVKQALHEKGLIGPFSREQTSAPPKIYLTDCSPHFLELCKRILEIPPEEVEYVDVG